MTFKQGQRVTAPCTSGDGRTYSWPEGEGRPVAVLEDKLNGVIRIEFRGTVVGTEGKLIHQFCVTAPLRYGQCYTRIAGEATKVGLESPES